MLCLCQFGYESLLERELVLAGLVVAEKGPGWVRASRESPAKVMAPTVAGLAETPAVAEMIFPQLTLLAPRELKGESVNALAAQLADYFFESLRGERIEGAQS